MLVFFLTVQVHAGLNPGPLGGGSGSTVNLQRHSFASPQSPLQVVYCGSSPVVVKAEKEGKRRFQHLRRRNLLYGEEKG